MLTSCRRSRRDSLFFWPSHKEVERKENFVSRGVEGLPNLGPYIACRLSEIGVTNEDELRKLGAVAAYRRLKFQCGRDITLNALWALDAALSGTDWRHLGEARKAELKALLDE
jgi:DNA transformation protein and related proteins